jgi:two-component system, OmpR family, response regulator MprA
MSRSHSVLVVDDHAEIRDLLKLALVDEGYTVRSAENGAAALERIRADTFAVILTDIQMPIMDGVEFVRLYRALRGHQAGLLIMTAVLDRIGCAEKVDADRFLTKPFELDDVLTMVGGLTGCEQ